jgi:DNA-directed RNA polymerase
MMKQKLVNSIIERLETEVSPRNPVKFLKDLDASVITDQAIGYIYLYTRVGRGSRKKSVLMAEIISAIGHGVRDKAGLKKNSALAAKAGAFILYTFEVLGYLHTLKGRAGNGHSTYLIEVDDEEGLSLLWSKLEADKTEKLPSLTPHVPWLSTKHSTGARLVKTQDKGVLQELSIENCPLVYESVNRSQQVGWRVNEEIYEIYTWALRNKTDAFSDIWEIQNPQAKASKTREAKAVGDIAKRFLGKTFYHLYYLDFRGRKYPATAYFHEQGTDLSKGLLLREDKAPIGEQGYYWLLISIASNWAGDAGREDGLKTDKIPLNDRVYWALDNEEILLSYVENPKVNQGWMKADKPWQFLAACNEWLNLIRWQEAHTGHKVLGYDGEVTISDPDYEDYSYESHLECYIDGSNNGSQHLSALTRDDVTAPHVNLVPSDLPGDLYKYVADHVWETIDKEKDELTRREFKACESVIDTLADEKTQINLAPLKSERRKELIEDLIKFKRAEAETIGKAACVFWSNVKDAKHRRKVVKR